MGNNDSGTKKQKGKIVTRETEKKKCIHSDFILQKWVMPKPKNSAGRECIAANKKAILGRANGGLGTSSEDLNGREDRNRVADQSRGKNK